MVLAIPALMVVQGCKAPDIYKGQAVIALTAESAMQSYADYFDVAIVDPVKFGTTTAELWSQRAQVDENWERYRRAMNLADDIRKDYVVGAAEMSQVQAALEAARLNSQAFIDFVVAILPLKYQPL
jgi:hypothetical protein